MKKILFIIAAMFAVTALWSQTTYTWNGGSNTWNTAANWTPVRTVPAANDIMVISSGGTITISDVVTQTIGKLQVSGSTTVILRPETTGNRTLTVSTAAADALTVASGSTLTIAGRDAVTDRTLTLTTANTVGLQANISGTIGVALDNSQPAAVGTFTKGGANATINMNSGSSYVHGKDGGTIPTATWNANSTCNITGYVNTDISALTGQTFGHFIWNNPGQTNNMTSPGAGLVFAGNLTIQNSSTFQFRFGQPGNNTIAGDLIMNGGNARISSNTARTVVVSGNVDISAGTLEMSDGNATGTLNVAGNFSHTGGAIDETGGSGSGAIVFNGSSAQVFTSGGTVSNTINYTVNSGAILNMAAAGTVVSGNSFTVSAGGTLGITSTAGIVTAPTASGNIQTTTRTFNTGGNYNYIGTGGAQVTGNALPATIRSLTVNNAAGVTLTNATSLATAVAATNPLILTDGILSGALITITNAYTGAGGGGSATSHVSGPLAKTGSTAYAFPVGNGSLYRPVSVASLSASATITAQYFLANPKTTFGTAMGAGINHIGVCEYWTLDDGVATVTGIVGLNFGGSCNGSPLPYVNDPSTLLVAHWSGTQWDNLGNNGSATGTSVTASLSSTFSPFTMGSSSVLNPLPVKIGSIKAYEKASGVQIDWTSYTEINVDRYIIERSADGQRFAAIGDVDALNTSNETRYGFFDASPLPGLNFYRIRNLDIDGKGGYSNIVRVDLGKTNKGITVYPNPVRGGAYLSYGAQLAKGNYTARIFNATGQQVFVQTFSHSGGAINQTIQLPVSVKSGLYTLQLDNEGVKVAGKAFMVQ